MTMRNVCEPANAATVAECLAMDFDAVDFGMEPKAYLKVVQERLQDAIPTINAAILLLAKDRDEVKQAFIESPQTMMELTNFIVDVKGLLDNVSQHLNSAEARLIVAATHAGEERPDL